MDVARAAGTSKATASRALSGNGAVSSNVRQAVKDAAERLGFEVNPYAQRLSTGMARNVVGLFSLTLDYMAWQTMSHLHHELAAQGYEAPLYTYGYSLEDWPDYRPLLSSLIRQQPQGLICNTFKLPPEATDLLYQYIERGGTVVGIHSLLEMPCDQVYFDRYANIRLAIRHLLEAGHREIGLGGLITHDLVKPLIRGFQDEIGAFGIDPQNSWLINAENENASYASTDEAHGATLADNFLKLKKRPSALCIINDTTAATFVHQLIAKGYDIPDDVSVIAIDGSPITMYSVVKISTVVQPREEMAAQAVSFLQERLNGAYQGKPRKLVFSGEVIARDGVRKVGV